MSSNSEKPLNTLPKRAGVGLKAQHYNDILIDRPDLGWFEVHPENYMGAGGPPHHYLTKIRENYALSLHGVGLSIGGAEPPSKQHLARIKTLIDRYQPESFSEHLAWSSHEAGYFNDLLPLPLNEETCATVAQHVDHIQSTLGRTMLLENPSTYVTFDATTMDELTFLKEVSSRTGCGLLLDINNVFITCTNHENDPEHYIDNFPMDRVGEIHLGGHAPDTDDLGNPLLIDAHDREVIDDVWKLYERAIKLSGPIPTLIEWDNDVPAWDVLFAEAQRAEAVMEKFNGSDESRQSLTAKQNLANENNHDQMA